MSGVLRIIVSFISLDKFLSFAKSRDGTRNRKLRIEGGIAPDISLTPRALAYSAATQLLPLILSREKSGS